MYQCNAQRTHIDDEWNDEHDNDEFQSWICDWWQYKQSHLIYTTSDNEITKKQ